MRVGLCCLSSRVSVANLHSLHALSHDPCPIASHPVTIPHRARVSPAPCWDLGTSSSSATVYHWSFEWARILTITLLFHTLELAFLADPNVDCLLLQHVKFLQFSLPSKLPNDSWRTALANTCLRNHNVSFVGDVSLVSTIVVAGPWPLATVLAPIFNAQQTGHLPRLHYLVHLPGRVTGQG